MERSKRVFAQFHSLDEHRKDSISDKVLDTDQSVAIDVNRQRSELIFVWISSSVSRYSYEEYHSYKFQCSSEIIETYRAPLGTSCSIVIVSIYRRR